MRRYYDPNRPDATDRAAYNYKYYVGVALLFIFIGVVVASYAYGSEPTDRSSAPTATFLNTAPTFFFFSELTGTENFATFTSTDHTQISTGPPQTTDAATLFLRASTRFSDISFGDLSFAEPAFLFNEFASTGTTATGFEANTAADTFLLTNTFTLTTFATSFTWTA